MINIILFWPIKIIILIMAVFIVESCSLTQLTQKNLLLDDHALGHNSTLKKPLLELLNSPHFSKIISLPSSSVKKNKNLNFNLSQELKKFYLKHQGTSIWINKQNGKTFHAHLWAYLDQLKQAGHHGLRSEDYLYEKIMGLINEYHFYYRKWHQGENHSLAKEKSLKKLAELELSLTASFMLFAHDLSRGKLDPLQLDPLWHIPRPAFNVQKELSLLMKSHPTKLIEKYSPQHPDYQRLQQSLIKLKDKNILWLKFLQGKNHQKLYLGLEKALPLRQGASHPLMTFIKYQLYLMEDMPTPPLSSSDVTGPYSQQQLQLLHGSQFNSLTKMALKQFQKRHGIPSHGDIDQGTLDVLKIPFSQRIKQIEWNLERWRWIPRSIAEEGILVNIANFSLMIHQQGQLIKEMKVVVGKPFRKTPVFYGKIKTITLNPYWIIPPTVFFEDLLPKIKLNPGQFFKQHEMTLFKKREEKLNTAKDNENDEFLNSFQEVDPLTIDWRNVTAENFEYLLRQNPGPKNPLGRIIFRLPNKHSIYLHDTPGPEQFKKRERTLSSGCIRLEEPIFLYQYLLKQQDFEEDKKNLLELLQLPEELDRQQTYTLKLKKPFPVYILYWTTWVDQQGKIHYRPDIYERDALFHQQASSF